MSEVWLTHPQLTSGHDFKCLRQSIGAWSGSGWQVRVDQSDPPEVNEPADPRPPVEAAPESVGARAVEPEPATPVPSPRSPKES